MIRQERHWEPVDAMLRRLKKELDHAGFWPTLRRYDFAQTKQQRRRSKSATARKRIARVEKAA